MESVSTATQVHDHTITTLGWPQVLTFCHQLAGRVPRQTPLYGIPTGGAFVAFILAQQEGIGPLLSAPVPRCVVVDDLIDSGATMTPFQEQGHYCDALIRKPHTPSVLAPHAPELDGWVQFPWEGSHVPTDSIVRLLEHIGEDPRREGLQDTPARVLRSLTEMTAGYRQEPSAILSTTFAVPYDEMVVCRDIEFVSLCEHHLLPFSGVAHVGYLPKERVVGLSKLARLVHCFARRLQVQERLTQQITDALTQYLPVLGAGAVIQAHHQCMSCRGVRLATARMVTSCLTGVLRTDHAARAEFFALCGF